MKTWNEMKSEGMDRLIPLRDGPLVRRVVGKYKEKMI
jgi:hypothetical protein